MEIKPIHSKADHKAALAEIQRLWDAAPGTPEFEKLEVLATLVHAYERAHTPILPVTSGVVGSHYQRRHRYPGTRPLARRRNSAMPPEYGYLLAEGGNSAMDLLLPGEADGGLSAIGWYLDVERCQSRRRSPSRTINQSSLPHNPERPWAGTWTPLMLVKMVPKGTGGDTPVQEQLGVRGPDTPTSRSVACRVRDIGATCDMILQAAGWAAGEAKRRSRIGNGRLSELVLVDGGRVKKGTTALLPTARLLDGGVHRETFASRRGPIRRRRLNRPGAHDTPHAERLRPRAGGRPGIAWRKMRGARPTSRSCPRRMHPSQWQIDLRWASRVVGRIRARGRAQASSGLA
jgi:hypothetical protein